MINNCVESGQCEAGDLCPSDIRSTLKSEGALYGLCTVYTDRKRLQKLNLALWTNPLRFPTATRVNAMSNWDEQKISQKIQLIRRNIHSV